GFLIAPGGRRVPPGCAGRVPTQWVGYPLAGGGFSTHGNLPGDGRAGNRAAAREGNGDTAAPKAPVRNPFTRNAAMKRLLVAATTLAIARMIPPTAHAQTGDPSSSAPSTITIDTADRRDISPYIYGVNFPDWDKLGFSVPLARQGGNRMTAYNWETNASNA